MADMKKNSHVFGSSRHSLSLRKQLDDVQLCSGECRHALLKLEVLVLNTGLIDLDTLNGDNTLPWGQEPGRGR